MVPTYIGFIVIAIGALLMFAPISAALAFTLFCSLFGAAAAINVPALGGSSIQPAHLALGFLVLRLILSHLATQHDLLVALRRCGFLVAYCLYGAATAFILPKIFDGAIDVIPMRAPTAGLYDFYPLRFGPQNITAAVYLIGTLVAAVAGAMTARRALKPQTFVRAVLILVWCHIGFGLLDVVLSAAGHGDWFDIVRNGSYAQLNQSIGEIKRISGTFTETSAYSGYAFFWMVVVCELWLRNIAPTATGVTVLALVSILLFTTSSTAYVGLAGYGLIMALRMFATPMNLPLSKALRIAAVVFSALTLGLLLAVISPAFWDMAVGIFRRMTVEKMDSTSGIQRSLWAKQGFDAFMASYGLGVGAGSFRSSSIVSAILGSVGVVGMAMFLAHLRALFAPFAFRTHNVRLVSEDDAVQLSVSWALVVGLLPSAIGAPSPDPGLVFGVMSGIALGLRSKPARGT